MVIVLALIVEDRSQCADVGRKETEYHFHDSREGAHVQDDKGRAAKRYILFVGEVCVSEYT